MGAAESKVEDIAAIAASYNSSYSPPLGAPVPGNPLVYFDLKLGRYGAGIPVGRVVIEVNSSRLETP